MALTAISAFLLVFGVVQAANATSDGATPYTVDATGITLPVGSTFEDNGHVNVRYTVDGVEKSTGFHFEGKCVTRTDAECAGDRHTVAQFIGQSNIPWSAITSSTEGVCITWIQLAQYTEHFGEGGQEPFCFGTPTPEPTETPTPVPSETPTPEPTPTMTPTPTPTPEPSVTPTPVPTTEPTPTPTATPTPEPTVTPTPTPTPTEEPPVVVPPTETPTPVPTPTEEPPVVPTPEPTEPAQPVCEAGEELQPAGDEYVCGPVDLPRPPVEPVVEEPVVVPPVPATTPTAATPAPIVATQLAETGFNGAGLGLGAAALIVLGVLIWLKRGRRTT